MKYISFLILIMLISCTGSLSDEQRKRIRESMEQGEIKKLSEAQIMEHAFAYGRNIATILDKRDKMLMNQPLQDSLSDAFQVEIILLQPENEKLRVVERQVMEAYLESKESNDNIQKMGTDSLLYTLPMANENGDDSLSLQKVLGIRMTRKQIVLSIKD